MSALEELAKRPDIDPKAAEWLKRQEEAAAVKLERLLEKERKQEAKVKALADKFEAQRQEAEAKCAEKCAEKRSKIEEKEKAAFDRLSGKAKGTGKNKAPKPGTQLTIKGTGKRKR